MAQPQKRKQAAAQGSVPYRCRKHGRTTAELVTAPGRNPWLRCVDCRRDQLRSYRAKLTKRPGAKSGEFFKGLKTNQGLNTARVIVPMEEKVWAWIEENHEKKGMAKGRLVNSLLSRAIHEEDPHFEPLDD